MLWDSSEILDTPWRRAIANPFGIPVPPFESGVARAVGRWLFYAGKSVNQRAMHVGSAQSTVFLVLRGLRSDGPAGEIG